MESFRGVAKRFVIVDSFSIDGTEALCKELNESLEQDGTSSGQAKMKRVVKNSGYYRLPKFFRAHLYFIYRYYIKLGFLDGPEGKIFHFLQAYWYRFLVDAKIYECERKGTRMKPQGDLKASVVHLLCIVCLFIKV